MEKNGVCFDGDCFKLIFCCIIMDITVVGPGQLYYIVFEKVIYKTTNCFEKIYFGRLVHYIIQKFYKVNKKKESAKNKIFFFLPMKNLVADDVGKNFFLKKSQFSQIRIIIFLLNFFVFVIKKQTFFLKSSYLCFYIYCVRISEINKTPMSGVYSYSE